MFLNNVQLNEHTPACLMNYTPFLWLSAIETCSEFSFKALQCAVLTFLLIFKVSISLLRFYFCLPMKNAYFFHPEDSFSISSLYIFIIADLKMFIY